jgi:hypothetical protein
VTELSSGAGTEVRRSDELADWVRKAYANHAQWAKRLHSLHDRLIQLNAETAAVLREISEAERNEQAAHKFVQETFQNWRATVERV